MMLSRSVWAANGPTFNAVSLHETMAGADEFRQAVGKEDRDWKFVNEMVDLVEKPPRFSVLDQIIPANTNSGPKPISISVSVSVKLGSIQQARELLSKWATGAQSRGMTAGLSTQVWGENGPTLIVRTSYDSVATADEARLMLADSDDYREFVANLAPHMDGHAKWNLSERIASASV